MRIDAESNRRALLDSYRRRDESSGGLPVYLIIESTNICNLSCVMCPRDQMGRSLRHMRADLFTKIIDEGGDFLEFVYLHMFGEPMLNRRIFEMIDMAEARGIRTGLSTNATLLDDDSSRRLLDTDLTFLMVSMDGATEETYERIRKDGVFRDVERNVERFAQIKATSNNKRLAAVLSVIDLKSNRREIDAFLEKWKGRGYDNVVVKRFHNWAGQVERINELSPGGPLGRGAGACYELWRGFAVQASGLAVPCCNDFRGAQPLGDLREQSIGEVWSGAPIRALRKMFSLGKVCHGTICARCPIPSASEEMIESGPNPFHPLQYELRTYGLV